MGNFKHAMVAIDSMVLVWGIRQDGPEDKKKSANWLFTALEKNKMQIMIPSIVLSEYLTPLSEEESSLASAEISSLCVIAPFDTRCAMLAAKLFRQGKQHYPSGVKHGRACLRADCMIIATAKAHGASIFYTGDKNCLKLAQNVITAKDLPDQPDNLFDY